MTNPVLQQLRDTVLGLPGEDRAELAHELLASLDGPPDVAAETAWAATIEHRVAEVDAGAVELVDGDELMRRARSSSSAKPFP